MDKRVGVILLLLLATSGVFAGTTKKNNHNIALLSSYMKPIDSPENNSVLALGLGKEFWGIFEFVGTVYFEIDDNKNDFFEMFKPAEMISAGIGVNIPMGGFFLKGDFQKIFDISNSSEQNSLSNYSGSFKIGLGIRLDENVEIDIYHKTMLNTEYSFDGFNRSEFVGIGLKLGL